MFFEPDIFNMFVFYEVPARAQPGADKKICPMCGLSFADITKSGKAGCGECYGTFKSEFTPNVMRIHGTANHTGKIPKNRSLQISAKRKTEELNARLKKMIDEQNFEEAAVIRDEINKINLEINVGRDDPGAPQIKGGAKA